MRLKRYLEETLNRKIEEYKSGINLTKKSLIFLKQINTNRADYIVDLHSLWMDEGEESTRTQHQGTLKEAIERAKAEFKKTNNRSDVQANCFVYIRLGDGRYTLPEEYWKKFREK